MTAPNTSPTALSHGAMGYVLKDVPTDEIKTGDRYGYDRATTICAQARRVL